MLLTETASFVGHFFHILTYYPEVLGQKLGIFRGSESGPCPVESIRALVICSTQEVQHPLASPSVYVGFYIKANGKKVYGHIFTILRVAVATQESAMNTLGLWNSGEKP